MSHGRTKNKIKNWALEYPSPKSVIKDRALWHITRDLSPSWHRCIKVTWHVALQEALVCVVVRSTFSILQEGVAWALPQLCPVARAVELQIPPGTQHQLILETPIPSGKICRTLFTPPLGPPWAASAPAISMFLDSQPGPPADSEAWHLQVRVFPHGCGIFLEPTPRKELRPEGQTDLESHSSSSLYLVKLCKLSAPWFSLSIQ